MSTKKVKVLISLLEKEVGKKVTLKEDYVSLFSDKSIPHPENLNKFLGPKVTLEFSKISRQGFRKVKGGWAGLQTLLQQYYSTKSAIAAEHIRKVNKVATKLGITWSSAYVQFFNQEKDYTGRGGGQKLTFDVIGSDAEGNQYMYDKYEGNVAGGGNSFLVGGKGGKLKVNDVIGADYTKGLSTKEIKARFFPIKKSIDKALVRATEVDITEKLRTEKTYGKFWDFSERDKQKPVKASIKKDGSVSYLFTMRVLPQKRTANITEKDALNISKILMKTSLKGYNVAPEQGWGFITTFRVTRQDNKQ